MEAATVVGAMVAGGLAGVYAGLGLRAAQSLDRHAELWFAVAVWTVCAAGAVAGGLVGRAVVTASLVVVALWSVMHFPNVQTLETELPRRLPFATITVAGVAAALVVMVGTFE